MAQIYNISDVMISYSRKDKPFVQALSDTLKKTGRKTWVDWDDIPPTANWWREIEAGIEAAHTMVFVISPNSIASKICYREVEHAAQHNKRIIPVLYNEVNDPALNDKMHEALKSHNWIMFRRQDDRKQSFRTLIKALETDLGYTSAHTRLLVHAREWETKNYTRSLLLRGDDLKEAQQWLQQSYERTPKPTSLQIKFIEASQKSAKNFMQAAIAIGTILFLIMGILSLFAFKSLSDLQAANGNLAEVRLTVADAELLVTQAANNVVAANETQSAAETKSSNSELNAESTSNAANESVETAIVAEETALAGLVVAEEDQATAVAAQQTAESDQSTAIVQVATAEAGEATSIAAQQTAEAAQMTANSAVETAGFQLTDAANLQITADAAVLTADALADSGGTQAADAQFTADAAQLLANQAELQAANAQIVADAANTQAANAQDIAVAANTQAANAQLVADAAERLADQAEVDKIAAKAEAKDALELKATVESKSDSVSLITEAQIALQEGNRPLALRLALLAVQRDGLDGSTDAPYATDSSVEAGLRFITSSVGLRQRIFPDFTTSGQYNAVWSVAISPDGNRLAIGIGWRTCSDEAPCAQILLYDITTGELLHETEKYSGRFQDIDWSADGRYIAGNTWTKTNRKDEKTEGLSRLYLFHYQSNKLEKKDELDLDTWFRSYARNVQFHPQFSTNNPYLIANSPRHLYLLKLENDVLSIEENIPTFSSHALAYSHDGNYVAVGFIEPDIGRLYEIDYTAVSGATFTEIAEVDVAPPETGCDNTANVQSATFVKKDNDPKIKSVLFGGKESTGACFSMKLWNFNISGTTSTSTLNREWRIGQVDDLISSCDKQQPNCENETVVSSTFPGKMRVWDFNSTDSASYAIKQILEDPQDAGYTYTNLSKLDLNEYATMLASVNAHEFASLWDIENNGDWDSWGVQRIVDEMCNRFYLPTLTDDEFNTYKQYGIKSADYENYECNELPVAAPLVVRSQAVLVTEPQSAQPPANNRNYLALTPPTPTVTRTPRPTATEPATTLPPNYIAFEAGFGDWQELDDGYGFTAITSGSVLTSSEIDLKSYDRPTLNLTSECDGSQGWGLIQVSVNNGDWIVLEWIASNTYQIDLSAYADSTLHFQIIWLPAEGTSETLKVEDMRIEDMAIIPTITVTMPVSPTVETLVDVSPDTGVTVIEQSPTNTISAPISATPTQTPTLTLTSDNLITEEATTTSEPTAIVSLTVSQTITQTTIPTITATLPPTVTLPTPTIIPTITPLAADTHTPIPTVTPLPTDTPIPTHTETPPPTEDNNSP